MNACASLGPLERSHLTPASSLLVIHGGEPMPQVRVLAWRSQGNLGLCEAELELTADQWAAVNASGAGIAKPWLLVSPVRLMDQQLRWPVLVSGVVTQVHRVLDAGRQDRVRLELRDELESTLLQPVNQSWWQRSSGLHLDDARPALLQVGSKANRSSRAWPVHGELAHVLQDRGEAWTVGDALKLISALAKLQLQLSLVEPDVLRLQLVRPLNLSTGVAAALQSLLNQHSLSLRRERWWDGKQVLQRASVRSIRFARKVVVPWNPDTPASQRVLQANLAHTPRRASHWIAQAQGWTVESTFPVVRGWDPVLEGQSLEHYQRGHPLFPLVADVHRLWMLNEAGRVQGEPAFDLAAFFGDARLAPTALSFQPCVSLDATGRNRDPLLEFSVNSGVSWQPYTGAWTLRGEPAGVYLEDAVLPQAYLEASAAGQARLRITASLRSPLPVAAHRYTGDALQGVAPASVLDVAERFGFRRVAADSVHHAAVRAGTLQADEADDSLAMAAWLQEHLRTQASPATRGDSAHDGAGSIRLTGAWVLLQPGDCLQDPVHSEQVRVLGVHCRWQGDDAPHTAVELAR